MITNRKMNPTNEVNNSVPKEIWASGARSSTVGKMSKTESAMKKPEEKAQTTPMLLLSFRMNMPAERVARKAMMADAIIGRAFIRIDRQQKCSEVVNAACKGSGFWSSDFFAFK